MRGAVVLGFGGFILVFLFCSVLVFFVVQGHILCFSTNFHGQTSSENSGEYNLGVQFYSRAAKVLLFFFF